MRLLSAGFRPLLPCVISALLIALSGAAAQAACKKDNCWGSIAFSRLTGYWVYSMNHPDAKSARSRAWLMCDKRCTNVVSVHNGCLAVFLAPRGRYTTGNGPTLEDARESARARCERRNRTCVFRVARCTADFEELKRKAREKAKRSTGRRPKAAPRKAPPARVEELKLPKN